MKTMHRLTSLLVAIVVSAVWFIPAAANTSAQKTDKIIDYNLAKTSSDSVQAWIDGDLTQNAGTGAEWYALALCNYGDFDFSGYETALKSYLDTNEIGSASSRQKYALVLIALGNTEDSYITETVESTIGEQGIMSLIYGLHLLNNGCKSNARTCDEVIDELLSLQLADGGWALNGAYGDVDVTAMTLQALAVHYDDAAVKTAINRALDFLSDRQLENGTYSSYGQANPESISQVIIALSSLGIDAATDGRFIKNGNTVFDGLNLFLLSDGSYCHKGGEKTNPTSTVQALCAFVAYSNLKDGKKFYVFSQKAPPVQEPETNEPPKVTQPETTSVPSLMNDTGEASEEYTPASAQEKTTDTIIDKAKNSSDCKLWAIAGIMIVCAVICIILMLSKKHRLRDYLIVLLIAVAGICLVLTLKIESVENHYENASASKNAIGTVTISIRCDTAEEKNEVVLKNAEVEIEANDTVYDVLYEVCALNKIHLEVDASFYVEGINNIYEKDYGDLSGWMYFVNGASPSVGCGEYKLYDGDKIEWLYTCELGKDLPYTVSY